MSKNTLNSKGEKFVSAMQRLAKKRSASRSTAPLTIGNVLTKKAPQGGNVSFGSKIDKPEGQGSVTVSEGQAALNPQQQGAKKGRK